MRSGQALIAMTLLLGGCAVTPREDPVQLRLDDLDARVGRIDRIVSNQSLIQMAQQLDALQNEIRGLRGQIEELQNDNAKLRKEQRDLYNDLDKRIAEVSAAAASANAAAVSAASAARPPPPPVDEQAEYSRALEEIRARNFSAAVMMLRDLAATFPDGALADNTQYWLGEAYYSLQDYDQAATAFQGVTTGWPDSRKVPDALLMLGTTQAKQNRIPAARATLQQVLTKYPDSDAARKAAERLAELPRP